MYIIYGSGSDIASKKFINISGCHSFGYHLPNQTGLKKILQTRYIRRIIYTLKPTKLCIILYKVWYQIQEIRTLRWRGKPVFWHKNDNHNFIFDKNPYYELDYLKVCWLTAINLYEAMGNLSTRHSWTHSYYGTIIQPGNLKLESQKIFEFMGKMDEW